MKVLRIAVLASVSAAMLFSCKQQPAPDCVPVKKEIQPVEQAPRADPGQNNFGGTISAAPAAGST